MTSREKRIAKNEAVVRDINEKIEDAHDDSSATGYIRMLCECGRPQCERLIAIRLPEYERIREDPLHFAIIRDHMIPDVERIVWETDRFAVIEKHEGDSAEVAIERDPRG